MATTVSLEVREFLNQWLADDPPAGTVEWLLEAGAINRPQLRKLFMDVYNDYKDDPDMRDYALRAKRAAEAL